MRLSIPGLTLTLRRVMAISSSFLTLSLLFRLARVLLFLLLRLPLFANLFELYITKLVSALQCECRGYGVASLR